jgi:hypothetical protein
MPSLESVPLSSPAASEDDGAVVYVDESDDEDDWPPPSTAGNPRPRIHPHVHADDSVRAASRILDAANALDQDITAMAISMDANCRLRPRGPGDQPTSPPSTLATPLGPSTHTVPVTPLTTAQRQDILDGHAADRATSSMPRVPAASSSREAMGLSPGRRRDLRASAYPNRVAPDWVDVPTYYAVRGRRLVIFRSRYVTSPLPCINSLIRATGLVPKNSCSRRCRPM